MLLTFKRRFASYVYQGTKTHTIRLPRAAAIKVGDRLDCYADARQATMALLGRWECRRIQPIVIDVVRPPHPAHGALSIVIDGHILEMDELDAFCWKDGFRVAPLGSTNPPASNYFDFVRYWHGETQGNQARAFPFNGVLIHWKFDAAARGPVDKLPAWLQEKLARPKE